MKLVLSACLVCLFTLIGKSELSAQINTFPIESYIQSQITAYQFDADNKFRLAAYAEMKGTFHHESQSLELDFGSLGMLTFYPQNCLFRSPDDKIYTINRFDPDLSRAEAINKELSNLFDQIILMGNHNADRTLMTCVDKHLANKNLEPFYKIFVRHILLRYGKYDPVLEMVTFRSEWVLKKEAANAADRTMKKIQHPLYLELTASQLLGVYGESRAEVFINSVNRPVYYATGEQYGPNISAFKIFVQQMLLESVQYVVQDESDRLDELEQTFYTSTGNSGRYVKESNSNGGIEVEPMYTAYSWIPMMLGLMRANGFNIGDKDVAVYLVNEPYFPRIYDQMNPAEKAQLRRNFPDLAILSNNSLEHSARGMK